MGSGIKNKPYLDLKAHPNYKPEEARYSDTIITFTLRFVGNLISPEQEENESVDIECVNIKMALASHVIEKDILNIWLAHQLKSNKK